MIQILHRGNQINLDLNTTTFTNVATADNQLKYLADLKAGRMVGVDTNGKVALASATIKPIGFIVVDASANPVENYPAVASKKLAVAYGDCEIITDAMDTTTLAAAVNGGAVLYVSETSGSEGLLTSTAPSRTESAPAATPVALVVKKKEAADKTIQIVRI